jgi:hypothetical protein
MFTVNASGGLPRKNVEAVLTSHNKAMAFTSYMAKAPRRHSLNVVRKFFHF